MEGALTLGESALLSRDFGCGGKQLLAQPREVRDIVIFGHTRALNALGGMFAEVDILCRDQLAIGNG